MTEKPDSTSNMEELVPEWVKEMHAYRNQHGFYRPADVFRVLGDPQKRVEVPVADELAAAKTGRAKGGHARAAALTPERRKEIAKKAIEARWAKDLPYATHEGDAHIGSAIIPAANLNDGRRVLSQGQFLRSIGRSRSPKAGTGALSTVDELPFFLQADALKPFISDDLRVSTKPVFYLSKSGQRAVGYDALLLPKVCNVYLDFRNAELAKNGAVPRRYEHIIRACDMLSRGLQEVGIIGIVDEATGFQEVRDRLALQEI